MPNILDYTSHMTAPRTLLRKGLRLMLWAGDGIHNNVSDVARLPGYDMFLCRALCRETFEKNVLDLSGSQTIVCIDVTNPIQMDAFCRDFRGAFIHIDSDYYGNTPTLPISYYNILLDPTNALAHNIIGINGLIMVDEDMLNTIELFAPILDHKTRAHRLWSREILSLAKRDDLSPGEVWSSFDLKHPFYDYARSGHERFIKFQKQRNDNWPFVKDTLQEQWNILGVNVIISKITLPIEQQYLEEFSRFLSSKIQSILENKPNFTLIQSSMDKMCFGKNVDEVIRVQQKVIYYLTIEIPSNIIGMIGLYIDERHASRPTEFGLTLLRNV